MTEKPKPASQFVAPKQPGKPTPIIPQSGPAPAGRLLQASDLTAAERMIMEKTFGYDGVSAVPSDIASQMPVSAEELKQQRDAILLEASGAMPPPMQMPKHDLDISAIPTKTLDKIPEELMNKYTAMAAQSLLGADKIDFVAAQPTMSGGVTSPAGGMQAAFDQAVRDGVQNSQTRTTMAGMDPSVAQAYAMLTRELESGESSPPEPEAAITEPVSKRKAEVARRKKDRLAAISEVDEQDLDSFKHAVLLGKLFTHTYLCFDGSLELTFGDYHGQDYDEMSRQLTIDKYKNRVSPTDLESVLDNNRRYALAAQLREVKLLVDGKWITRLAIPADLSVTEFVKDFDRAKMSPTGMDADDTALRAWSLFVYRTIISGSLRQVALASLRRFQATMLDLQFICQDPESF